MRDINGNVLGLKGSPEAEAGKSYTQKKEECLNFFKIAFCVDGEVKIHNPSKKFKIFSVVELNDSKRGKFYIGVLKEVEG